MTIKLTQAIEIAYIDAKKWSSDAMNNPTNNMENYLL